jgi:hypothetical protein
MKKLTFLALIAIIFVSCGDRHTKTLFIIENIETFNNQVSVYKYYNSYYDYTDKLIDSCNKWNVGDTIKFK